MSLVRSIQTVLREEYAEFRGVASRSEYWWWILFTFLVSAGLGATPVPMLTIAPGGDLTVDGFDPCRPVGTRGRPARRSA